MRPHPAPLLLLAATGLFGACRGSPTPLPPPPVATFGNEHALLDDDPWEPGLTSYGGVGTSRVAVGSPASPPTVDASASTTPDVYVEPPYRVARGAAVYEAPPPDFALPGISYPPPSGAPDAEPTIVRSGTPTVRRMPAFPSAPWRWHRNLEEARNDARAQGKLLFVFVSNPNCGICDTVRARAIEPRLGDLASIAVGYTFHGQRPERPDLYRTIHAQLAGAQSMPLVAFLGSELEWIHGFWGNRSPSQFAADIALVRGHAPRVFTPDTEMVIDAPVVPGTTVSPPPAWPDPIASAPPTPTPRAEPPAETFRPLPTSAELMPGAEPGFDLRSPPVEIPIEPAPPPVASLAEPVPELSSELAAEAGPWGRERLLAAFAHIRGRRYVAAEEALREVGARLVGTAAAREAQKGSIAIYNAKRMDLAAPGTERERYRERAARDLAGTIWEALFRP